MKRLSLFVCLFAGLLASCKQEPPSPSPPVSPTPITSASSTEPPQIRTSELKVELTTTVPTTSQQDIAFTPQGAMIAPDKSEASFTSEKLPITLSTSTPFLALSAKWTSIIAADAKLTVSVRASTNGNDWSDWQLSSLDGDPRTQAGLFFFPPENRFMQYRVELQRSPKRSAPQIQIIKFRFISPGATPANELANLQPAQHLTRNQWHCPDTAFKAKMQAGAIHHLIVHHTATANDATDWPAVVRTIWNFHAVTNGWRDVGYHYLIDPNGVIYEGRAGGDQAVGIHFSCANTSTMGIAMLGNYLSTPPTEAALQSLEQLLAAKCDALHLDPLGKSFHPSTRLNLPHIAGHQDANASPSGSVCKGTHCPGEKLYALLPLIRQKVAQKMSRPTTLAHQRKEK